MYQRIKTHTKKKQGLFSTKSINSMIENAEAEKWLSIEMLSEDADNAFVDPIKMALDIRREYIDAALIKVAKGYISPENFPCWILGISGARWCQSYKERNALMLTANMRRLFWI